MTTLPLFRVACQRCGRECQPAAGKSKARILRRAQSGLCVDCAITDLIKQVPMVAEMTEALQMAPLRQPHIQAQYAALLKAGNADASPDEIDWERVIANWRLP